MSRWVVCSTPDCPELHQGSGRCEDCRREAEKQRGTSTQRGYDAKHRKLRAAAARQVAAGQATCWRCNQPIPAGADFDLGHDDNDRSLYGGPEHPACNRATRARRDA